MSNILIIVKIVPGDDNLITEGLCLVEDQFLYKLAFDDMPQVVLKGGSKYVKGMVLFHYQPALSAYC